MMPKPSDKSPQKKKRAASKRQTIAPQRPGDAPARDVAQLDDARQVLSRFTLESRKRSSLRPTNFEDRYAVAALELCAAQVANPRHANSVGAWLCRLQERDEGRCAGIRHDPDGRLVLVLDLLAAEELQEAMAEHRASLADYAQLQGDLAYVHKLRRDGKLPRRANR